MKYLLHKTNRMFLIIFTFLIVNTLIFSMISIYHSANNAISQMAPEEQNYFSISSEYDYDSAVVISEGSTISMLTAPFPITQEVLEKIRETEYIEEYAYQYQVITPAVSDLNGTPLKMVSPEGTKDIEDSSWFSYVRGVSDSKLLYDDTITLREGEHIESSSRLSALISTEYADLNHLSVGDKLRLTAEGSSVDDAVAPDSADVTIIGLFEPKFLNSGDKVQPYELASNDIFIDFHTASVLDPYDFGMTYAKFYVSGSGVRSDVIKSVKNLEINWDHYSLIDGFNETVVDSDSIKKIAGLFLLLTGFTILISLFVITMILILQARERISEVGIFLSLGVSKRRIMLQHFVEILLPALLSLLLSPFISSFILKAQDYIQIGANSLQPQVSVIAAVLLINLCLIITATYVSCFQLLNMKPGDIFVKLS
ncbi:FtsX-like permease family protein [Murimonas intestini]